MPASAAGGAPDPARCTATRAFGRVLAESQWVQRGATVERQEIPADFPQLIQVEEQGVHVEAEIVDGAGAVVARAESPVERSATLYAYLPQASAGAALIVRTREPSALRGTVRVEFLGAASPAVSAESNCANALWKWAAADESYASAHAVTLGRITADPGAAHAAFAAAARDYGAALEALTGREQAAERSALELNLAALAYYGLKDWTGAASWGASAATTFAATHQDYLRARAQGVEAAAWIELATRAATTKETIGTPGSASAQFARARALLRSLAQFHAARGEAYDEALQINNIGLAYTYESRFAPAIPPFAQAQRAFEQLGDVTRSALALQNIGYAEWGLGRLTAAIGKFDRALELMASMDRPNLYLNVLNNDGLAHYEAGRLDEALSLETRALDLAVRFQSDQARARSDFGIGVTYYSIGDRELAADFLRRALAIATPELDARLRVDALRALAQIESESGHLPEAIAHDEEALQLATASWARARILLHLAQQYAARGNPDDARRILEELIAHPPSHDELVSAMARVQRARLLREAGAREQAQTDLRQAIATFDRFDALAERFEARVTLAQLYAEEGRDTSALKQLQAALRFSREIRAQTANPEYRTSIIQSLRPAESLQVDLLRERFTRLAGRGDFDAAQSVARESLAAVDEQRAAGFEAWRGEYLEQSSDTELAHLLASSSALYRDMAERRFELAVREDRAGTADARAQALREDIARLRARVGVLSAEIARRSRTVAGEHGGEISMSGGMPRVLPPGQGAIEYWLGTTHAYAWVLKEGTVDWIELPASSGIERAARALHERMRTSATSPARREACAELNRLALAPLRSALTGVGELILVPDGALHYVPFAALLDPARVDHPYLVQAFTVAVAPALRFLSVRPAMPAATAGPTRMLLVADPIYTAGDARLGASGHEGVLATSLNEARDVLRGVNAGRDLVRLESSAREAAQIRDLLGARNVDLLEGEDATREAVLARDLSRYRFIHIASHGMIDSEIPQLSALILGTRDKRGPVSDPYLRAADLLTRTFHAQAIVLSACDTALGKEYGSEGLVGLRYAALARGAHAVVASLWPVSDGVAATLMTDMYRGLVDPHVSAVPQGRSAGLQVARSLAAAMRATLERAPALDPALWAAFTVYVAGD
ncbi:MAG TPA: CHAT domain-containing protein [Steroidobacteraceae bacterium]|nr:CHAT domain-containing protein [Steroidobacteraceae bacterium]